MNIIDKVLLEWSYKTKKGYPDINNEEDVRVFESMFGIELPINEVGLTPMELGKENSKSGERRINILIRKIKAEKPLKLTNGKEFLVHDPAGQIAAALEKWDVSQGSVTLPNATGETVKTSQIEKTEDFGGGSGSGGGAANTDIQESAQCLINALAFRVIGGKIEEKDLTRDNLIKANNYVNTTTDINGMMSFVENDASWRQSTISTANELLKVIKKKDFQFHRGSDFVNKIYGAWKAAKKNGNLGSIKDDKWNPADIWAVDSSALTVEFQTDLDKLNNQLIDLYNSRTLIGISLKKTANAKAEVYNLTKSESLETLTDYIVSPKSIDAYLIFSNGAKLQLRAFDSDGGGFQGELKGETAAQGKIGGGILKSFMAKHNLGNLPSQKEVKQMVVDLSDDYVERFSFLLKKYADKELDREDMENLNPKFLRSKYQALEVLDAFKNGNPKDVQKASGDILSYAGSQSSISSVYVKVS